MNLEKQLKEGRKLTVALEPEDHKYLLARNNSDVMILSKDVENHKEIYKTIENKFSEEEIPGGGRISFNPKKKEIFFYDISYEYGPITNTKVLKKTKEDPKIESEIDAYPVLTKEFTSEMKKYLTSAFPECTIKGQSDRKLEEVKNQ